MKDQTALSTMRRALLLVGMKLTLSGCMPFGTGMLGHGLVQWYDAVTLQNGHEDPQAQKTLLEILEERYARGELNRDAFLKRKHGLEN